MQMPARSRKDGVYGALTVDALTYAPTWCTYHLTADSLTPDFTSAFRYLRQKRASASELFDRDMGLGYGRLQ